MAKRVQRRRGTTAEHATFTGAEGEITVDTTKDTAVVHDGSTAGGIPLAREDQSNVNRVNSIGVTELNLTDGTAGQVIKTNGSGTLSFTTIDAGTTAVGGDLSGTVSNAQIVANSVGVTELNLSDGTNGQALKTNGSGTLSFGDVVTDPSMSGHVTGTTSSNTITSNVITSAMLTTALKNFTIDEFTGNGVTTTFTLTASVGSINALLVYINGVVQPTSAYALPTATSIQFLSAPVGSSAIRCLHLGFQSTVGVPSDGTITAAKLAANAVTSSKILDGTIVNADIANDAITDSKIASQTITEASIVPNTITNISIANATVTGTQIADNSINGTKIALGSDTQGDVMYYDGANWARLGPGTAGLALVTGGSGANPSWSQRPYDMAFLAGYDKDMVKEDVTVRTYGELVMARAGTFEGETGYIDTAPNGNTIVDIEKNGTSIYSTKPQFTQTNALSAGTLSTTIFAAGDRITFKVTTLGSSSQPGKGARVTLKCKV
jgi:hypothetical protein